MRCSCWPAVGVAALVLVVSLETVPPASAQDVDVTPHVFVSGDLATAGSILGGGTPFNPDGSVTVPESSRWIRTRVADYDAFRLTFTIRGNRAHSQVFLGLGNERTRADVPSLAIPLLDRRVPGTQSSREDFGRDTLYLDRFATLAAAAPVSDEELQSFELRRWPHGGTELLVNGRVVMNLAMSCCGPKTWLGFRVLGEPIEVRQLAIVRMPASNQLSAPLPGEPMYSALQPTRQPAPEFPSVARQQGITGSVVVVCLVDADGRVRTASVIKSLDIESGLDREAVRAVRNWRFRPARLDGLAMPAVVTIEQSFSLR